MTEFSFESTVPLKPIWHLIICCPYIILISRSIHLKESSPLHGKGTWKCHLILYKGYQLCACFSSLQTMEEYMSKPAFWQQLTWYNVTKGKETCLRSVGCVLHSGHNFSLQEITDFIHEGMLNFVSYLLLLLLLFSSQCLYELLYQFHSNCNRTESGFMLCFWIGMSCQLIKINVMQNFCDCSSMHIHMQP